MANGTAIFGFITGCIGAPDLECEQRPRPSGAQGCTPPPKQTSVDEVWISDLRIGGLRSRFIHGPGDFGEQHRMIRACARRALGFEVKHVPLCYVKPRNLHLGSRICVAVSSQSSKLQVHLPRCSATQGRNELPGQVHGFSHVPLFPPIHAVSNACCLHTLSKLGDLMSHRVRATPHTSVTMATPSRRLASLSLPDP
ncbi:hypothetical protein P154DRAFT_560655 [Amniculicola lignicola CBS 123094]|uniref:Uncharacterized protein n=1 Tax=Amniculicola lignicola CBS 123094 TaxID=1392246 RepID=A0A6A5X1W4_9PLEO|nr:hypothetical protein P154DRAFT_560655 [Amniculicola lignicola CBS 123094]